MPIVILAAWALVGASPAEGTKVESEDKVVCKRQQDADTGSHFAFPKRVCRKKSEWKEIEDAAAETMDKLRNGGAAAGPLSPSGSGPH